MKTLVKLGLMAAVVMTIHSFRGQQAEEFEQQVRQDAEAGCAEDSGCLQALTSHFDLCYAVSHSSQRRGRYNRKHSIDQAGFDACLAKAHPRVEREPVDLAAAEARLEGLGLLSGAGAFGDDAPEEAPATVQDLVVRRGSVHWFDTETGFYPNEHHVLLGSLARLAGEPLSQVAFEEEPPPLENREGAPYRLRARLGERHWEVEAADHGDWYDVASVLSLLNRVAQETQQETRFVSLPTGDQSSIVLAGPEAALRAAVDEGLLEIHDPGTALRAGKAFEAEVLSQLQQP